MSSLWRWKPGRDGEQGRSPFSGVLRCGVCGEDFTPDALGRSPVSLWVARRLTIGFAAVGFAAFLAVIAWGWWLILANPGDLSRTLARRVIHDPMAVIVSGLMDVFVTGGLWVPAAWAGAFILGHALIVARDRCS